MAGASRSFYMDGNATKIAAEKLLNNMRKPDGTFRTYEEMKAEGIETKVIAVSYTHLDVYKRQSWRSTDST